ncbi:type II toxin-antitoxin system prevent-host-death family antitoxin [Thermoactinospora rubra]|uniref:type II toxin-antitoxin system prevent-host-death family antitoxin n=1 Tax=Thermoactinospora rubra TaxID=1088767 RepID=UPI000A10F4EB|nr:type II toxin-antitoxin system prevent-host-death family antitoxin [Thermoactinospora rubra]
MSAPLDELPEISQWDLKHRAAEIMDAIEHGQAFVLTRNGRRIAVVTPISRRRTFVSRERMQAAFSGIGRIDDRKFAEDVRAAFADDTDEDAYDRAFRRTPKGEQ